MKLELPVTPEVTQKLAVNWLNNLCWHDSVLHEIRFIRKDSADQVILIIDLIQEYENFASCLIEITFHNCWLVKSNMNWGIHCISDGEQVMNADTSAEGALLEEVQAVWPHLTTGSLTEFHLLMASTMSTLDLVFTSVSAREINGPATEAPILPE